MLGYRVPWYWKLYPKFQKCWGTEYSNFGSCTQIWDYKWVQYSSLQIPSVNPVHISQSSHTCTIRNHIHQNMSALDTAKCHKLPTSKTNAFTKEKNFRYKFLYHGVRIILLHTLSINTLSQSSHTHKSVITNMYCQASHTSKYVYTRYSKMSWITYVKN